MYPPIGEALEAAGLGPVEYYIIRRQNTIAQYITTWQIYEICTGMERMALSTVPLW